MKSLAALLLLNACSKGGGARPAPVAQQRIQRSAHLTLSGSAVMAPLLGALGKNYQELYPGIKVSVTASSAQQGNVDTRSGAAMIGMRARNQRDEELDLQTFPIARDGLVFAVRRDHPVSDLSRWQLAAIVRGAVQNWESLGAGNAPIRIVHIDGGREINELLAYHFPMSTAQAVAGVPVANVKDMAELLAADSKVLAILSVGEAAAARLTALPLKLLSVDGQAPLERNLRKGQYPLLHAITLVTRQLPEGETKLFIDYCLSAQATLLVKRFGFIPYLD